MQHEEAPRRVTNIELSKTSRARLFKGMSLAAECVGCTLGPRGRTVLIQNAKGGHIVTKDGVSVSKAIALRDPVERMGADLVREAASQTNELAGDGTTTSTVLTHALVAECMRYLDAGVPATALVDALDQGLNDVVASLKRSSIRPKNKKTIVQIASISANNDRSIGELVSNAIERAGTHGVITVEDAKGLETSLQIVEGMRFERGFLSPYFITNNEHRHIMYDGEVLVYVTDRKLQSLEDVIPLLEMAQSEGRPTIVIAGDVELAALQTMVVNRVKANIPIVAVKAPGYGDTQVELLKDICTLTGAKLVSSSTGTGSVKTRHEARAAVGVARKIIVDAGSTTIVSTDDHATKERVLARISDLTMQQQDVTLEPAARANIQVRIARLTGGVAVIRAGGATEIEMIERRYRIEDALHAARAAMDEGIVAGGGCALVRASKDIRASENRDIQAGLDALTRACEAPMRRIVSNADGKPDVVVERVECESDIRRGYDARSDRFVDMLDAGIIDPCKVTRLALTHAVSVAKTFVTLDAVVYDEEAAK